VRAVLDPNVLIAAVLSPHGAPAHVLARWLAGEFELVLSERLLAELARALAYPKLTSRIAEDEAVLFIAMLRAGARVAPDVADVPSRSTDPGDDYLLALAESERAVLVSGDHHLLALAAEFPVQTAREFLDRL
jgi:uncharacterized protein